MISPFLVDVRPSSNIFSLRLTYSNIISFLENHIKFDCFLIIMDLRSTTAENPSWLQYTAMELLLYLSTFFTSSEMEMTERLVSVIKAVLHYWEKKNHKLLDVLSCKKKCLVTTIFWLFRDSPYNSSAASATLLLTDSYLQKATLCHATLLSTSRLYTYHKIRENNREMQKTKSVKRGILHHFFRISRPFLRFTHFAAFRSRVGIHTKSQRILWFIFSRH